MEHRPQTISLHYPQAMVPTMPALLHVLLEASTPGGLLSPSLSLPLRVSLQSLPSDASIVFLQGLLDPSGHVVVEEAMLL